jgi:hypothetical protein
MVKAVKAAKKVSNPKKAVKPSKVVKKAPTPKKAAKKPASKTSQPASRRALNDVKIGKLQKMYHSNKFSAQHLCDEFGISMATLFNYLKVKV